jgi:hypothetical protein
LGVGFVPPDALTARHTPCRLDGNIAGSSRQVEKGANMKKLLKTVVFLMALAIFSGNALATDDIFNNTVGQSSVTVGLNTITIENNVKYVNYILNDVLHVELDYTATCNVVVTGVQLRSKAFTPKNVAGNISNVVPSVVGATGSVTFDLQFTALKKAGKAKNFGMAHLDLLLSVDDGCTGSPDTSATIGAQVSASTAIHP